LKHREVGCWMVEQGNDVVVENEQTTMRKDME